MIDALASIEPGAYVAVCGASLIMGLVSIPFLTIAWINRGRARASQGWPTVTGQVLEARVVEDTGGENGPTYKPRVRYAYDVGGRQFANDRVAFGGEIGDGNPAGSRRTVARYPAGAVVPVYYDPANPQDAVLERRSGVSGFMFLVGGGLLALSCCLPAGLAAWIVVNALAQSG